MKIVQRTFTDEIHGYIAKCGSKSTAWMLIRNKCKTTGKKVPLMTQIKEIN